MPRPGFPTGILVGLAILLVVEALLRFAPEESRLLYGRGVGADYEVRNSIEELGAAEVAIMGTSRGREAILVPKLKEILRARVGRAVPVANYSCADAKSDLGLTITRRMVMSPSSPRILVYFVSPRLLLGEMDPLRSEIFGRFPDLYGARAATVLASLSERPMWQLKNGIESHYLSFRHRYWFRYLATSGLRGRERSSPIQGGYSVWQLAEPERSLAATPLDEEKVRVYLAREGVKTGDYALSKERISDLVETIRLGKEAGIQVVMVREPYSQDDKLGTPVEVEDAFSAAMSEVEEATGLRVLTMEDLEVPLGRENFREHVHLNFSGAALITESLAERVLIPALVKEARSEARPGSSASQK